jgi:hypothetical protein
MKIYALLACLFLHTQVFMSHAMSPAISDEQSTPQIAIDQVTISHDSEGHSSATFKPSNHSAITLVLDQQGAVIAQKKLVCMAIPFKIFSRNSHYFICESSLPSEQEISMLKAALDKHKSEQRLEHQL